MRRFFIVVTVFLSGMSQLSFGEGDDQAWRVAGSRREVSGGVEVDYYPKGGKDARDEAPVKVFFEPDGTIESLKYPGLDIAGVFGSTHPGGTFLRAKDVSPALTRTLKRNYLQHALKELEGNFLPERRNPPASVRMPHVVSVSRVRDVHDKILVKFKTAPDDTFGGTHHQFLATFHSSGRLEEISYPGTFFGRPDFSYVRSTHVSEVPPAVDLMLRQSYVAFERGRLKRCFGEPETAEPAAAPKPSVRSPGYPIASPAPGGFLRK